MLLPPRSCYVHWPLPPAPRLGHRLTINPAPTSASCCNSEMAESWSTKNSRGTPSNWHILTPDATGSYINGTWSSGGNLPSGYAPWFFGSQVLLDGKTIVIEGGEYNNGSQDWTNLGAVGTISGSPINWTKNNPLRAAGEISVTRRASSWPMEPTCRPTAARHQIALFNGARIPGPRPVGKAVQ